MRWRLPVGAAVVAAIGVWGWARLRPVASSAPVTRFALRAEAAPGVPDLAVSPDGSALVYVGSDALPGWHLVLRRLDREQRVAVPGTDGASQPFFSPDGASIGFLQNGRLRAVSLAGDDATTILDVSAMEGSAALNQVMYGATWGSRGQIVFATARGLFVVSANGGMPRLIARPDSARDEWYFLQPTFVDEGTSVLVNVLSRDYEPRIALVSLANGQVSPLGVSGREPKFVPPGHLLFTDASGRLLSTRVDLRRRRVVDEPRVILESIGLAESPPRAFVDVSRSGTIAYVDRLANNTRELVLVDRRGVATAITSNPMAFRHPRFSPDGRRVAVGVDLASASGEIWMLDLATSRFTRLTFDSLSLHPTWSRDGEFIVFPHPRLRNDRSALFRVRADGGAPPESLLSWPRQIWEAELAADGKTVVFRDDDPRTIRDVYVARIDSVTDAHVLFGSTLDERAIALAPDGGWLAYVSNANGHDEVYIRRLEAQSPQWSVSVGGGSEPRWARDGHELFFRHDDTLFAAPVQLGRSPRVGPPRPLFRGVYQSSPHQALYDPSPDGRAFVMVRNVAGLDSMSVHVVLHWFDREARSAGAGPSGDRADAARIRMPR